MVQSRRVQRIEGPGTQVENRCADGQADEHEALRVFLNL